MKTGLASDKSREVYAKVYFKGIQDARHGNDIVLCKDCRKIRVTDGMKTEICPLASFRGLPKGHEFDYQYCAYGEKR